MPYALCPMPYAFAACALSGISVLLHVSLALSFLSLSISSPSLSPLCVSLSLSLAIHTPFSFGSHFFPLVSRSWFFLSSSRTYMSAFTKHFPTPTEVFSHAAVPLSPHFYIIYTYIYIYIYIYIIYIYILTNFVTHAAVHLSPHFLGVQPGTPKAIFFLISQAKFPPQRFSAVCAGCCPRWSLLFIHTHTQHTHTHTHTIINTHYY